LVLYLLLERVEGVIFPIRQDWVMSSSPVVAPVAVTLPPPPPLPAAAPVPVAAAAAASMPPVAGALSSAASKALAGIERDCVNYVKLKEQNAKIRLAIKDCEEEVFQYVRALPDRRLQVAAHVMLCVATKKPPKRSWNNKILKAALMKVYNLDETTAGEDIKTLCEVRAQLLQEEREAAGEDDSEPKEYLQVKNLQDEDDEDEPKKSSSRKKKKASSEDGTKGKSSGGGGSGGGKSKRRKQKEGDEFEEPSLQ
jgi:uncharacterized membrane protein YgcG